jgi:hypothetical protein
MLRKSVMHIGLQKRGRQIGVTFVNMCNTIKVLKSGCQTGVTFLSFVILTAGMHNPFAEHSSEYSSVCAGQTL